MQRIDTFIASGTWTCPAGVTSVLIHCFGAGGGGTLAVRSGGGGACALKTLTVVPTTEYAITVGLGAVDTDGGDSSFESDCVGKGGKSGTNGGAGGQSGDCTGDSAYSGGSTLGWNVGGGAGSESAGGVLASYNPGDPEGGPGYLTDQGTVPGCGGRGTSSPWERRGGRGEVRIFYEESDEPAGYAVVKDRTYFRHPSVPFVADSYIPAGVVADELLILLVGHFDDRTFSIAGWTEVGQYMYVGSARGTLAVYAKIAVGGGSDTCTIDTDGTSQWGWFQFFRVSGATADPTDLEVTFANGLSLTPDAPDHTPTGGSAKYLWIACAGVHGSASGPRGHWITANPANYRDNLQNQSIYGGINEFFGLSCIRHLEASSENPGAWTQDGLVVYWVAATISVPALEAVFLTGSSGIASAEAFGAGGRLEHGLVGASGIASALAFDEYGILYENIIDGRAVAGITSALAFGSGGKVAGSLTGSAGIASAEAFGSGGAAWIFEALLNGTGCDIASALAFGTGGALAGPLTGSTGIASAEAFGTGGALAGPLTGSTGIASAEAFESSGSVTGPIVGATGIASAEAFGTPGYVAILVGSKGIPSPTIFGTGGSLSWSIIGFPYQGIKTGEAFGTTGIVLQLSPVNSVFSVFIGGTQRNQYVRVDTLSVDRQVNFAASASFEVLDEAGNYFPVVGEEVLVYFYDEDGSGEWERIFAGSVNNMTAGKLVNSVGAPEVVQQLECVDYGQVFARRIVTKKFPQSRYGTLTKILDELSVSYFEPEGIKYISQGDPGITIADLEFSCVPLGEVIAKLGELTGWDAQIDFGKNFMMYDRPNLVVVAPWNIAEDSQESYSVPLVTKHRGLYRNRQCIKANLIRTTSIVTFSYTNPTNEWTDDGDYLFYSGTFLEDGRYSGQIQRIISVKVDDVDVPWYIPDDETAPADWDYAICWGSKFGYKLDMIWNLLGKPGEHPGEGSVLSVTFEVLNEMPRPICVENTSEIAARRAIEGGTGIYTAVEEVQDVTDRDVLLDYAESLLNRFSEIGIEVNIETHKFGLEPGMQITVDLPSLGVSNQDYLIESMTLTEQAKTKLLFEVKISNLIQQRDALAAFQRLIRRIRKSSSTSVRTVQFDLAVTMQGITNPGLMVGTNVTNEVLVRTPITLKEIAVSFKTPPEGQSILLDIKADGVSVLGAGLVEYTTAGGTVTYTVFTDGPLTIIKGQKLSIDVIQVGSTQPGKDGTVTITGWA